MKTPLEQLIAFREELDKEEERLTHWMRQLPKLSAECPPELGITMRCLAYDEIRHHRASLYELQRETRKLIERFNA